MRGARDLGHGILALGGDWRVAEINIEHGLAQRSRSEVLLGVGNLHL